MKILVVDDEEHLRRMMRLALEASGYEVAEAADGTQGLALFADGRQFDATLLDQKMPGMDGLETLRRMKLACADACIIMVTAHATIDLAVDAMKLGATDFVRKPMTPDTLRHAVEAALAKRAGTPAAASSDATVTPSTSPGLDERRPIEIWTTNGFFVRRGGSRGRAARGSSLHRQAGQRRRGHRRGGVHRSGGREAGRAGERAEPGPGERVLASTGGKRTPQSPVERSGAACREPAGHPSRDRPAARRRHGLVGRLTVQSRRSAPGTTGRWARGYTRSLVRKILAGLLLGLGSGSLVWLLAGLGWVEPLELKTYDWRIRHAVADPPDVSPDIVLVEINDTSIRDLAPFFGRWPWPRLGLAQVVAFLERAPAKVIAVDVGFLEPQRNISFRLGDDGPQFTGEQSDAMLADAIRSRPNVVLLADAVYEGVAGAEQANKAPTWKGVPYRLGPAVEERPLVIPPFQSLTDAAGALGHNFLPIDPDGPARRMPPFIRVGDRYMPSLGLAAALMALGTRPDDVVMEGRQIRIGDRVLPLVATRVEDVADRAPHPRPVVDPDQLPGAGARRRPIAVPVVRGAAPDPL